MANDIDANFIKKEMSSLLLGLGLLVCDDDWEDLLALVDCVIVRRCRLLGRSMDGQKFVLLSRVLAPIMSNRNFRDLIVVLLGCFDVF